MDTTRKNRFLNAVRLACIVIFIFSFMPTSATAAGADGWQSIGPEGGAIVSLAIDPASPATIYAGTGSRGAFKSIDGGQSWTAINTGLTETDIQALAIVPSQTATLYAGTVGGGVFKSTDSGARWTPTSNGLTDHWILSLAIDPQSPWILYAGTWQEGIFKSYDGGNHWTAINTNLADVFNINAVAIHPADPNIVYIGTGDGVFKTTDGGGSWSPVNDGLPDPYTPHIEALVMDPASPDTLYAAGWQGIFKTTNGGVSWTEINNGLSDPWINSLAVDPLAPGTIYAGAWGGVYKSMDGGARWDSASNGLSDSGVRVIAIDPLSSATVYAGGYGDLFKSSNAAGDWSPIHNGLTATSIQAMAVDPLALGTLYIGIEDEIYKTTDDGLHWTPLHVADHFPYPVRDRIVFLVADPVTPQTVYAGIEMKGILKSTDGGGTWKEMNSGLLNYQEVHVLVIDPWTPDTLYAAARNEIYKSMDGGQYWQRVASGLTDYAMEALAMDPLNPATVYAGSYGGELFKTIDGGASWTPAGQAAAPIQVIRVDPKLAGIVHVGTAYGILKTTDGGLSWSASRLTGMSVEAIAIDPVTSATLYAGTTRGVFKSTDIGMTWNAFNTGLGQLTIHELAANPLEPMLLYAGTEGAGAAKYSSSSTACQAAAGQVVINEIFPSPSNNGTEWVELYNTTAHPVNISYCYVDDIPDAGSPPYQIPAYTVVPAHGFWTLDQVSYFDNAGDEVRFLKEDAATLLDSHTYGNTGYGLSQYRLPDGGPWQSSPTAYSTKGQSNVTGFYPFVASIIRTDENPTSSGIVNFLVTFTRPVTGVNTSAPFSDFTLNTTGGIAGASISKVTGSDATYLVSVNTGTGAGSIRLDVVDDDSIRDAGNNPLGGTGSGNGNFLKGEFYSLFQGINIKIGTRLLATYSLVQNQSQFIDLGYLMDGPVQVTGTRGATLFTSEQAFSGDPSQGNSFNEVMGYPANQLTTEYWFPWYDNKDMSTWILVGNASSSQTAAVDIYVGGLKRGSYTIPIGGRITPRFNLQTGPVRVVSTNGANIFTSERTLYGTNNSFNEVMGYPANQLTTEYWFPWYDNKDMSTWILVGNASTTSTAAVDIYIGGIKRGSYAIPKGGRITPRFSLQTGPVRVVSTNGVKIFSSERTLYGNSFNEVMGYPGDQLTTEYWFPSYDNLNMSTWVLVGNPTTRTATVDIYLGGIKQGSYTLAPNGRITPRFNRQTGPLRVVSTNGVNIFASERVLYGTSFNEVMGYPGNKLTTEYWFPWYDSISMYTGILLARP